MTARRFTTHGNSRPHIVHNGYQNRMRVPGPLVPMDDAPSTASVAMRLCGGGLLVVAGWGLIALLVAALS